MRGVGPCAICRSRSPGDREDDGLLLESFREVAGAPEGGRMLVSTVDAWCRPVDFARFVSSALRRPREATVLAVTPLVDDEKPLGVTMDAEGRVTALGVPSPALVTAGVYLVSERARRLEPPPRLGRLREHLGWLLDSSETDVRRSDRNGRGRGPRRGCGAGRIAGRRPPLAMRIPGPRSDGTLVGAL